MSRYHDLFLTETREHLKNLSELTIALEADPGDKSTIDELFRSVHSVKGMAASMGFDRATEVAHKLEDLMDSVRKGLKVETGIFDLLLAGESALSAIVADITDGGSGNLDTAGIVNRIIAYQEKVSPGIPSRGEIKPVLQENLPSFRKDTKQTVRVKTTLLDHFLETTGELITTKHRLTELARISHNYDFSAALLVLGKHLRDLQDQVMTLRLMPLAKVTERFPRMIRDLARSSGKEITFSIKGAEIEIDRSILDLIGDPLSHLLRNSVDHGIETPRERVAQGKSPVGRISISVSREKDQVEILVGDDGRGMDAEKIARAAVAKGFLPKEKLAALSAEEKLLLICHPGFSTARKVTELSGRGVGMDVVRTAIQSMGGALSVVAESGAGSSFLLRLPLTIAIMHVLLIKVGSFTLAIPLTAVDRTLDLGCEDLVTVDGVEICLLNDETLPIVPIGQLLNIYTGELRKETVQLFVTSLKGQKIAIEVDQILGQQEIFVKALPRPLSAIKGISGASVLGNGEIVFIIDIREKF